VCHRNVSNNCISAKRSVFQLNVSILAHTHTHTGFSVLSALILRKPSQIYMFNSLHRVQSLEPARCLDWNLLLLSGHELSAAAWSRPCWCCLGTNLRPLPWHELAAVRHLLGPSSSFRGLAVPFPLGVVRSLHYSYCFDVTLRCTYPTHT